MLKRLRAWFGGEMQGYVRGHNSGLFRDAFTQLGYPIELFSDAAIQRAAPQMFAAVADASAQLAEELREHAADPPD